MRSALTLDTDGQTCTHVAYKIHVNFTSSGVKAVRFMVSQGEVHV